MRTSLLSFVPVLLAFSLLVPGTSRADSLLIGQLSFDSGLAANGDNTIDLLNLTGGSIGPGGVQDNLTFNGTLTVTPSSGPAEMFTFSIDDNGGTLAYIPVSQTITSATISLTLSNSIGVNILDSIGNPKVVNLGAVGNVSLPLNGAINLTPCDIAGDLPCSSTAFYVDTANLSATPEPSSFWLLLTGLGSVVGIKRRMFNRT